MYRKWPRVMDKMGGAIHWGVGGSEFIGYDQRLPVMIGKPVSPPGLSQPPTLNSIAAWIKSGQCLRIAFLTGAGISVNAGLPDYRSAGGMLQTLNPDLLTATEEQRETLRANPDWIDSYELFKQNQLPYLEARWGLSG